MKKNHIWLVNDIVWNEKIQIILLSVFFSILVILMSVLGQKYEKELAIINGCKAYNIDEDCIIYNGDVGYSQIDQLKELDSVSEICEFSCDSAGLYLENEDTSFVFNMISGLKNHDSSSEIYPIHTVTGKTITSLDINEIILDAKAQKYYSEGDSIVIPVGPLNTEICLVVRGFVSEDENICFYSTDFDNSLNGLFCKVSDINDGYDLYDENGNKINTVNICAIASRVIDSNNQEFQYKNEYSNRLLIRLNKNSTIEDFYKETEGLINGRMDNTYTFEQLFDSYYETNSNEIGTIITYVVAVMLIVIVSLIGVNISWFTKKRSELITYYILGLTWGKCILISLIPYCISILIGYVIGIFSVFKLPVWLYDKTWRNNNFLVCELLILFILYFLCSLPYYFAFINKKPIDLYKTKE